MERLAGSSRSHGARFFCFGFRPSVLLAGGHFDAGAENVTLRHKKASVAVF